MDQSFFMSKSFDVLIIICMLIFDIVLYTPVGESIIDWCTPKDKFGNQRALLGEQRTKYRRALAGFCTAIAFIELIPIFLVDLWVPFEFIYIILVIVDLIVFARVSRKIMD